MKNTTNSEAEMDNIISLITNEEELDLAQKEMERLLDISERTTNDDSRLGVLAVFIRDYEDRHWALEMPDPIFAIQSRMDDLGLHQTDLLEEFGNKTTASHIMNRKRFLTLPIIRRLAVRLTLPVSVLTQEYSLAECDENLIGTKPTKGERSTLTKRVNDIYEALSPETKNGENQHSRVRQVGEGSAADVSKKTERIGAGAYGRQEQR